MLGFNSEFETTLNTEFNPIEIPGGYTIEREIVKAVNGKDFFYNNNENGKPIRIQGISFSDFWYYFVFWEDWHVIKQLPHGKGTLAENRWLLDLLKFFEKANTQIEYMLNEQEARKPNG